MRALLAAVAVAAAIAVVRFRLVLLHAAELAALVLAVLVLVRLVLAVVRFARLDRAGRRYWLPARWHKLTFKRLARNLGLAEQDKHLGGIDSRRGPKVIYPKVKFRPTSWGFTVSAKLTPFANREAFESVADHLGNRYRAVRVEVGQSRPGRAELLVMRRDPLTEPVGPDILPAFDGRHLVLGRDSMGNVRKVNLANMSASVISGNPGRGKSESATSMAVQLVPSPAVELYVLDGGGGLDWSAFAPAAVAYADDNLADAEELLLELHQQMMNRRRTLEADHGVRNGWKLGPRADLPLRWLLVEEAGVYYDEASAKGDRERERRVRACRGLTGQLIRRGRAPMHHTTMVIQKAVSGEGGLPPFLRDLAGLRFCFGVSSIEAAVGCLGEDVRRFESLSPVQLQGEEHVGIASVLMKSGLSPITLIKFPGIGQDLADEVAGQAAKRRAQIDSAASPAPAAAVLPAMAEVPLPAVLPSA